METDDSDSIGHPSLQKKKGKDETSPEKKTHYPQNFSEKWLKVPEFSPWLKKHPNKSSMCLCDWCGKALAASRTVLKRHIWTRRHKKSANNRLVMLPGKMATKTVDTQQMQQIAEATAGNERDAKGAELKYCLLLAEHDISYTAAENTDAGMSMENGLRAMKTEEDEPPKKRIRPKRPKKVGKKPSSEKKERVQQTFCELWLQDPRFSPWLRKHATNSTMCVCKWCGKSLCASKTVLLRHITTSRHEQNAYKGLNPGSPDTQETDLTKSKYIDSRHIMKGELRYCLLLAEHNLNFACVEQLVVCSQKIFSDSKYKNSILLTRQKATGLIKHVLSEHYKDELKARLQDRPFSILLNESSDMAGDKILCILVQFVDSESVVTELLDLVELCDGDGTSGVSLLSAFKNCLQEFGLSVDNIVGCCSDMASEMVGRNGSFMALLLNENPNIFFMGSVCMHLVASRAVDELPKQAELFVCLLFSYFSKNVKLQSIVKEIQDFGKAQMEKIYDPSRTRWLSILTVVERILEHYSVLSTIFQLEVVEDRSPVACMILEDLNNPVIKATLEFMAFILPFFNEFNALFQSNTVIIGRIESEAGRLCSLLCSHFLKPESYVGRTGRVNCMHPSNVLPLQFLNIGRRILETLAVMTMEEQIKFKIGVIKFYQVAVNDLQARFPIGSPTILSESSIIEPMVVLSGNEQERKTIPLLLEKYKRFINSVMAEHELKDLHGYFEGPTREEMLALSPLKFCAALKKILDKDGFKVFTNIARIFEIVMTLPYASADVERIFTMINDIKAKNGHLQSDMVSSILRIQMGLSNSKKDCVKFSFTKEVRKKYQRYKKASAKVSARDSDTDSCSMDASVEEEHLSSSEVLVEREDLGSCEAPQVVQYYVPGQEAPEYTSMYSTETHAAVQYLSLRGGHC